MAYYLLYKIREYKIKGMIVTPTIKLMKKNAAFLNRIRFFSLLVLLSCLIATAAVSDGDTSLYQSLSREELFEKMLDIAGVEPGMVIGEIGAGGGDLAVLMAKMVGANGKIYANDISEESIKTINRKEIQNIVAVLGESDDPLFPAKNLDMVIMKNVFHDLENPLCLLENLKKYLKKDASFVVIEPFRSKDDNKTAISFHKMTKAQIRGFIEISSLKAVQPEFFLPSHWNIYILKVDENKEKNVWMNWLNEFQTEFQKIQELEKVQDVSPAERRIAWARVLNSYRDNDPETDKDDRLRQSIKNRIDQLTKEIKRFSSINKRIQASIKRRDISTVQLRSEYRTIDGNDIYEIQKHLGFNEGFRINSGDFPNQFEPISIQEDKVVVDHASGLIWHPSGSDEPLDFFAAQEWINDINILNYAGYSNWRLPTVEELLSLIETEKIKGDTRIDPVFSNVQNIIWTGDTYYSGRSWSVNFSRSTATLWDILKINPSWVRPVRSLN